MPTRILVVDDEPTVCESVSLMLSQFGCVAETASNGTEALDKLKAQSFELVMTDFLMRGVNGRQLAWVIKSLYPRLPIILFTGCYPADPIAEVDCILLKPFSPQQLWEAMGQVFVRVLTATEPTVSVEASESMSS